MLDIKGVSKSFFGTKVLSNVDFSVRAGEVHALMGENGAGKSTLMKIIMGVYRSDGGEVFFEGKPVEIRSTRDALNLGISMIPQELNPIMAMTVAENVFVGREARFSFTPFVNRQAQNERAYSLLKQYGMEDKVSPTMKMSALSIAQVQMMEIIKAVSYNAKVIIMDEPTSSLSENETAQLFKTINLLKKNGVGIIYISHRMDEVMELSDRVSILRDGLMIGCVEREDIERGKIISMMVGRELQSGFPINTAPKGETALSVRGLRKKNVFEDISFDVRAGEILGFAGLVGAGRSEVMRALVGFDRLDAGEVRLYGKKIVIRHPRDAKRHRIAFASEDRKALGLMLCRNIKENISIQNEDQYQKAGFVNRARERAAVSGITKQMSVKMKGIHDLVATLSGGNQQKVVLSKCLLSKPKVLILDEPTRGIDVGAKAEIYHMMVGLARQGIAILMISSEMPELIGMSDRILVMSGGRINAEVQDARNASQEEILKVALEGV